MERGQNGQRVIFIETGAKRWQYGLVLCFSGRNVEGFESHLAMVFSNIVLEKEKNISR